MRIDAEKKSREQNDLKNHFVTAPYVFNIQESPEQER